jgi:hypothetical protein
MTTAATGGASHRFSTSHLGRLGFGVGGYSGGGEPRFFEPVAPTPSYSAAQQGPTSPLTGWASPIRTRVKGPMSRWAHW